MGKQARNRSRELRDARAKAEQRGQQRNRILAGGGGLVILGMLIAIVIGLINAAGTSGPEPSKRMVIPATATAAGAITVGSATATVKVEVYLDYMCPYCGRFDRANGGELNRLVADGVVKLELYPLSFLDRMSDGTRFSTRAANAIATVADRAPDKILAFNTALYERQPAEGSAGLSDDEIAALATTVGVPPEVVGRFHEGIFEPWVAASTNAVLQAGVSGTPTIKINGTVFQGDLYTVGPLTHAITTAASQ